MCDPPIKHSENIWQGWILKILALFRFATEFLLHLIKVGSIFENRIFSMNKITISYIFFNKISYLATLQTVLPSHSIPWALVTCTYKVTQCMHCIICIYWCILGLRLKAYCWWFWCLLQFQLIFYQIYIISAGHAILLATGLISSGRSSLFFVTSYNDLSSLRVPLNIENIHWKSCKLERINVNRLVNDGHLEAGMNDFVNYVQ